MENESASNAPRSWVRRIDAGSIQLRKSESPPTPVFPSRGDSEPSRSPKGMTQILPEKQLLVDRPFCLPPASHRRFVASGCADTMSQKGHQGTSRDISSPFGTLVPWKRAEKHIPNLRNFATSMMWRALKVETEVLATHQSEMSLFDVPSGRCPSRGATAMLTNMTLTRIYNHHEGPR
jgi:hypothetical protein